MKRKMYHLKRIEEVSARNTDSFQKIIDTFINNTSDDLEKIQQLVLSEDWKAIASIAHKLISGFGYMEAKPLKELAKEIERNVQDNHLTDIKEKINRLCNDGSLLIKTLKTDLDL
jgi:HPt (histidine-containing phosphotransfer) domain-containing protein